MPYVRHSMFGTQIDPLTDCVNREIRASASTIPTARLVALDTWTCPSPSACRKDASDGSRLRYDGLHFKDQGAEDASRWILDQVFVPPAAQTT